MKNLLILLITTLMVVSISGCQDKVSPTTCHIQGTMGSDDYDGKLIFLVPLNGAQTAETVDSIEIKGRKFEFKTDSMQMYKILLDYHYRLGIQPLLVVGESGEVKVTIDSVSHCVGTPQNDSLEQWKVITETHNRQLGEIKKMIIESSKNGNPRLVESLNMRADSIHLAYKNRTRQMAANLKEGVLSEFLARLYPTTYRKKLPDGRIVTMNADTNEEIPE